MFLYNVKNFLKKSHFLKEVNAKIKELLFHREYKKLFFNTKESLSHNYIGCPKFVKKEGELVIIWVGACYEQDYSGFRQSLSKFGEVIDFYNADGKYGLKFPKVRNTLIYDKEREENDKKLLEIYHQESEKGHVDLVIGQMWSTVISPSTLDFIREKQTLVVNIAMDDKLPLHWRSDSDRRLGGAIGLSKNVDLTLNTSKQAVSLYHQRNAPCMYWPLASDPNVFYSTKEKIYDVVFVGSNYGHRQKLINHLKKNDVNVKTFGPGFDSGMISAEQTAETFSKAKIVLGIGYVAYSSDVCTLKLRDFDAMFTGALYVTSRNEDLEEIFEENVHIAYYDDKNSLVEVIKYYLRNDSQRNVIADNAFKLASKKHTWDYRIRSTLNLLGLISNE